MDAQEFQARLIAAIKTAQSQKSEMSEVAVYQRGKTGVGQGSYEGRRWVRLNLIEPIGSIVAMNVMPYRLDLDTGSGNLHPIEGSVQFVACVRSDVPGKNIGGPGVERRGPVGVVLNTQHYCPGLDESKSINPGITVEQCFEKDGTLSVCFVKEFQRFVSQIRALPILS